MEHPISRQEHGAIDWAYVPTVAALPALVGFSRDRTPTRVARAISGVSFVTTFFTRFEWGIVRVLPFKAHLAADAAISALAVAAPWLFGFADDERARNTFVAIGLAGLVIGALTRPEEMPHPGAAPTDGPNR